MQKLRLFINAFGLIAFVFGLVAIAQAQAARTWVSGLGNDANTCSRTAPCATFAGALAKTNVNGEINCVNPSGYGAVTITKSVTIDCEDTQGSTVQAFVTGITINLGSESQPRMVRLRGLSINGSGGVSGGVPNLGNRGIHVTSDNTAPVTLHIDQVVIDNFSMEGILFNAPGGELLVRNSVVQNCGETGLMVDSSDGSVIVHATVEGSSFVHNNRGIHAETATRVTVSNCNISNNVRDGVMVQTADNSQSEINLYNCYVTGNRGSGVLAVNNPGVAIIRLDGNHIVNNFAIGGGTVPGVRMLNNAEGYSRGNNTISGNDINVSGVLLSLPSL
jgi:parallel beta helix pectate lyase-like protein